MLTGQTDEPDDGKLTPLDLGLLCIAARHYAATVVQYNLAPDELRIWRLQQFDRAIRHANIAAELLRKAAVAELYADEAAAS